MAAKKKTMNNRISNAKFDANMTKALQERLETLRERKQDPNLKNNTKAQAYLKKEIKDTQKELAELAGKQTIFAATVMSTLEDRLEELRKLKQDPELKNKPKAQAYLKQEIRETKDQIAICKGGIMGLLTKIKRYLTGADKQKEAKPRAEVIQSSERKNAAENKQEQTDQAKINADAITEQNLEQDNTVRPSTG